MNHLDIRWQEIFNAVLEDCVRMSAADFHELQRSISQGRNLAGQLPSDVATSIFVDEFHSDKVRRRYDGAKLLRRGRSKTIRCGRWFRQKCRMLQKLMRHVPNHVIKGHVRFL